MICKGFKGGGLDRIVEMYLVQFDYMDMTLNMHEEIVKPTINLVTP